MGRHDVGWNRRDGAGGPSRKGGGKGEALILRAGSGIKLAECCHRTPRLTAGLFNSKI